MLLGRLEIVLLRLNRLLTNDSLKAIEKRRNPLPRRINIPFIFDHVNALRVTSFGTLNMVDQGKGGRLKWSMKLD